MYEQHRKILESIFAQVAFVAKKNGIPLDEATDARPHILGH